MTLTWSPELYARHAGPRLRPALDLLAQVPLENANSVVDLGCGSGALFPALLNRFRNARLIGVDVSAAMLAKAAEVGLAVELVAGDAATWRPDSPVDLIIANAALHWVPGHERLIPELMRHCRVLAVQVPDNFTSPAYRQILDVMAMPRWAPRLAGVSLGKHVLSPERYVALLRAVDATVDLWQTIYHQQLAGSDAVLDWVRGTTLLPVHAALGGAGSVEAAEFEQTLGVRLRIAYPADAGGTVAFPFRRLFFVASRAAI